MQKKLEGGRFWTDTYHNLSHRCRDPGVTPPPVDPVECTPQELEEIKSSRKCGIFLLADGPLKGCLDAVSASSIRRGLALPNSLQKR